MSVQRNNNSYLDGRLMRKNTNGGTDTQFEP